MSENVQMNQYATNQQVLTYSDFGMNEDIHKFQSHVLPSSMQDWGAKSNYRPGGGGVDVLSDFHKSGGHGHSLRREEQPPAGIGMHRPVAQAYHYNQQIFDDNTKK